MQKNNNSKLIIFIIVVAIMAIPWLIDKIIFANDVSSNLTNSEWGGFLGSYIGSIISVIGAFAAIKFQLFENNRREKENKKNNIKNVTKKILELNLEEIEKKRYEFTLINDLDLNVKIIKINERTKLLYEFPKDFLEDNINGIIDIEAEKIDFLKKLYSIISQTENFNKDYSDRTSFINQRNEIIKEKINFLKDNINDRAIIIMLTLIIKIRSIMRNYSNYFEKNYTNKELKIHLGVILKNKLIELDELYNKYLLDDSLEVTLNFLKIEFCNITGLITCDLDSLTKEKKVYYNIELGKIYLEVLLELFELTKEEGEENRFLEYYCREIQVLGKVTKIKGEIEELIKIL